MNNTELAQALESDQDKLTKYMPETEEDNLALEAATIQQAAFRKDILIDKIKTSQQISIFSLGIRKKGVNFCSIRRKNDFRGKM